MAKSYYFSTKDLVTIAVIAALGGVLSTYVGYLGNMLNKIMGVPFGAGQFMAGLHIFWLVLAFGLTKKTGTPLIAGVLKGFVEFLSGGKLGVLAVILTVFQALFLELVFFFRPNPTTKDYMIAGGISTMANILFSQIAFATYDALPLFLALSCVALLSGVVFAGLFPQSVLDIIETKPQEQRSSFTLRKVVTIAVIFSMVTGAVYFYATRPESGVLSVTGMVEDELSLDLEEYESRFITINTEMVGKYQYIEPKDYTGVPLRDILDEASPTGDVVKVIASDAYEVDFPLDDIMENGEIILTSEENGDIQLIAPGYEGGNWVRMIVEIKIV